MEAQKLKLEMEAVIVQSIWYYPQSCITQVFQCGLKPEEFEFPAYRKFLQILFDHNNKEKLDTISLYHSLEKDDRIAFNDKNCSMLTREMIPITPLFFDRHIKRLRELNQAIELSKITLQASNDFLTYNKEVETVRKTHEAVIASTAKIEKNKSAKVADIKNRATNLLESFDTHLITLNNITGGIKKGHFWILGGSTSYGKSLIANCLTNHWVGSGHSVAYFTLEMTQEEVYRRISEIDTIGDNWRIYEDVRNFNELISTLKGLELQSQLPEIIVIDYLQLFRASKGQDNYNMLRELSHNLQALAVDMKIAILGLSQMNRQSAKDNSTHGFKGAGDIEESADVAIEIERIKDGKELTNEMILHITKNRHGSQGKLFARLEFNPLRVGEIQKLSENDSTGRDSKYQIR